MRNLHAVLAGLGALDGLETLIVEQDERPALRAADLPVGCRLLFAESTGPFNKSRGFNIGYRASTAGVLLFSDADIVVPRQHLDASIAACDGGIDLVRPWADVVDLTEDETRSMVRGSLDLSAVVTPGRRGRLRAGEVPPLCGGAYVIRRDAYERLGGQDERFRGWGGEDDAMSIKVARLCPRAGILREGLAFHLYHPRHAALPVDDPDYQRNVALVREYAAISREALDRLCEAQRVLLT